MKSHEEILNIINEKGLDPNKPMTISCQGGVTACILFAALRDMGYQNCSVYDGSWSEFSVVS